MLGRLFIIPAILGGVTFFSIASAEIIDIHRMAASGKGKFRPTGLQSWGPGMLIKKRVGHVVVMGSGVASGSAVVLESFLKALCGPDADQANLPEVVLFARTPCSSEVRTLLEQPWAKRVPVRYFVGTPMDEEELERIKIDDALMTFIIADSYTRHPDSEDRENILRASAVRRIVPNAPMRLMLMRVRNLEIAERVGLDPLHCFSINSLKASLLLSTLRCPGLSTMILNLGIGPIARPNPMGNACNISPWLNEYIEGTTCRLHGFLPGASIVGVPFSDAAVIAGASNIALIAIQHNGHLVVNPASRLTVEYNSVLFGIMPQTPDTDAAESIARTWDVQTWAPVMRKARGRRASRTGFAEPRKVVPFNKSPSSSANSAGRSASVDGLFKQQEETVPDVPKRLWLPGMSITAPKPITAHPKMGLARASIAATEKGSSSRGSFRHLSVLDESRNETNTRFDDMDPRLRSELPRVVENGGHVIIALLGEDLWHQIEALLTSFRKTHATAVVIVGNMKPPKALFNKTKREKGDMAFIFENLYFIRGSPEDGSILAAAGAKYCSRFISLAPSTPPTSEELMMDRENLLVASVIESQLQQWGRPDLMTVYDWYSLKNVRQLPLPLPEWGEEGPTISRSPSISDDGLKTLKPLSASKSPPSPGRSVGGAQSAPMKFNGAREQTGVVPEDDASVSSDNFETKSADPTPSASSATPPKLGTGSARKMSSMGAMTGNGAGTSRYTGKNQGLLRRASSFVVGGRVPALSDAPKKPNIFLRRTIPGLSEGDLSHAVAEARTQCRFASGRVLPKSTIAGLYTVAYDAPGALEIFQDLLDPFDPKSGASIWLYPVPRSDLGKKYCTIAKAVLDQGAVPIGILRNAEASRAPLSFVVTACPQYEGALLTGDTIYVLADQKWASENMPVIPGDAAAGLSNGSSGGTDE